MTVRFGCDRKQSLIINRSACVAVSTPKPQPSRRAPDSPRLDALLAGERIARMEIYGHVERCDAGQKSHTGGSSRIAGRAGRRVE